MFVLVHCAKYANLHVFPNALITDLTLTTIVTMPIEVITMSNGSPGLVGMGGDSCSEGRGFESWHCILDGHFSHIFVVKIVMMFL